MTLLVPTLLAIAFGISWSNNLKLPTVSQSSERDVADISPPYVVASCETKNQAGDANPFCPLTNGVVSPPLGFQYVPNLAGSACARSIKTLKPASGAFNSTFPWRRNLTSPAVAKVEEMLGLSDVGATDDAFQLTTYDSLSEDLFVDPNVWAMAGNPLTQLGAPPPPPFVSQPEDDVAALLDVEALSSDADLQAEYPTRIRTDLLVPPSDPADANHMAARYAAAAPSTTISTEPIPLCSYPPVSMSASIKASPGTSGIGYILTLPAYFNWSSFASNDATFGLTHYLMPTADGLIKKKVPLQVIKGSSTLGGSPLSSELEIWRWYARTMGYDKSSEVLFPYVHYDVDVVRTVFNSNGSETIVTAKATVTAGKMSHFDAVNYYGYGQDSPLPALAACGDVYAVPQADVEVLYDAAVASGYVGSFDDFIDDDSVALADMLPPTSTTMTGGCDLPEASLQGWPTPTCSAAQAARSAAFSFASQVDLPLTFNVTNPTVVAQLRAAYARIRNTSNTFIHAHMFTSTIAPPSVRQAQYGMPTARMHAASMAAQMQLQHGCGLYCSEPRVKGIGSASSVWFRPTTSLAWNTRFPGLVNGTYLLSYVQRFRPQLICNNASTSLMFDRDDPQEFYGGDMSRILQQPSSTAAWTSQRLAAPAVVVLFRLRSWKDVSVSSTQQSLATIIGSTLGFSGLIILVLRKTKKYTYLLVEQITKLLYRHAGPQKQQPPASVQADAVLPGMPPQLGPQVSDTAAAADPAVSKGALVQSPDGAAPADMSMVNGVSTTPDAPADSAVVKNGSSTGSAPVAVGTAAVQYPSIAGGTGGGADPAALPHSNIVPWAAPESIKIATT